MKETIRKMIEEALPLVDVDSEFLFGELDSLGITTILMMISEKYGIEIGYTDVTPRNFKTIETLTQLVETKIKEQKG